MLVFESLFKKSIPILGKKNKIIKIHVYIQVFNELQIFIGIQRCPAMPPRRRYGLIQGLSTANYEMLLLHKNFEHCLMNFRDLNGIYKNDLHLTGINLPGAKVAILLDSWWNSAMLGRQQHSRRTILCFLRIVFVCLFVYFALVRYRGLFGNMLSKTYSSIFIIIPIYCIYYIYYIFVWIQLYDAYYM